jgi:hypothetical protein
MVRRIVPSSTTRAKVNEKGGGGEGVMPKSGRNMGVEQKCANESSRVRRTRSSRPFCCEVYGQVRQKMVSWEERRVRTVVLSNSFPLSV